MYAAECAYTQLLLILSLFGGLSTTFYDGMCYNPAHSRHRMIYIAHLKKTQSTTVCLYKMFLNSVSQQTCFMQENTRKKARCEISSRVKMEQVT